MQLASDMGYMITVYCFLFHNWSKSINEKLLEEWSGKANIEVIYFNNHGGIRSFISGFISRLSAIAFNFSALPYLYGYTDRRALLLKEHLTKCSFQDISLIVGHNPFALMPVYQIASKQNIPFGFDVEDYHPGEYKNPKKVAGIRRYMSHYLEKAAYISAASPLILEQVLKDLPTFKAKSIVINNYFRREEFTEPERSKISKLKLVWFSQNIDKGRGLESLLPVIKSLSGELELHLYGNLRNAFHEHHLTQCTNIFIHKPLPQEKLHHALAKYDIGIALEDALSNFNRDICLTNKILAYFQSGLYILASSSRSQKAFLESRPGHGQITGLSENELFNSFKEIIRNKEIILATKNDRYQRASEYSWEKESKKLAITWQEID